MRIMMDMHLPFERPGSDIKKEGYLKKIKTMKKKYFVLRSTSSSGPARLEYYDNEKKFRNSAPPKRSILLHTCFNINRKSDSKHKYAIALYTNDDSFSMMADTEAEREEWLTYLLKFQNEYLPQGDEACREHYEHVWQVTVQAKGLGSVKGIKGPFRLCLSSHSITLFRVNQEKPVYSFQLATVRSVAHSDCCFKLEVGSWAPTGSGDIWMQVEDSSVAQNMHEAILQCMKSPQLDMVDDVDAKKLERFDARAGSCSFAASTSRELRPRTMSESHTNSPLRVRQPEPPRPMSYTLRSSSLPAADMPSPGTSPHSHLLVESSFDRIRSDSVGSRSSRTSYSIGAEDHLDGFSLPSCAEPPSLEEEDMQNYSMMNREPVSTLSSPGDCSESGGQASAYMEMGPGGATAPVVSNLSAAAVSTAGYVDMTLSQRQDTVDHGNQSPASGPVGDPYMMMRPPSSSPIPIHAAVREPGYMDMAHSTLSTHSSHGSHLPTVQEGGSSDGYLPMTPSFSQSPRSSSFNLRPERGVCMLSDETGEFHQRTLSLGSRPLTKVRVYPMVEGSKKVGGQLDTGRSCSAPHLMATKPRGLLVDSPTPSASPLSLSLKSDDLDSSFMQMDFNNRPRTGSESYSNRPRASSFGARANQPGHRPRSSSHGQSMRPFKLKLNALKASSQEYIGKNSFDSFGRMSRDSLRMSSNESLRRQDEARCRSILSTDYMDMSGDKRKTPSPLPPGHLPAGISDPNGYMDMTLGSGSSRSNSPHHSRYPHSQASSIGSSERLDSQAGYTNMELPRPSSSSSSGSTYMSTDAGDQGGKGSGKHSRSSSSENVDSYVMYEPSVSKSSSAQGLVQSPGSSSSLYSSAGHLTSASQLGSVSMTQSPHGSMGHVSGGYVITHAPVRSGSGSVNSMGSREDGHHRTSQESVGSRSSSSRHSPKRRGSRDSGKREQAPIRVVQIPPSDAGRERRRTPPGRPAARKETDDYIEFSPLTTKSGGSDSGSVGSSGSEHQPSSTTVVQPQPSSTTVVQPESQYVDFQPGQVGPLAPASSSFHVTRSGGGAFVSPSPSSSKPAAIGVAAPSKTVEKEVKEKHHKDKRKKDEPKGGSCSAATSMKKAEEQKLAKAVSGDYFNLSSGQKPEVGESSGTNTRGSGRKKAFFSKAFTPEALSRPLDSMYSRAWTSGGGAYYQEKSALVSLEPEASQVAPQEFKSSAPGTSALTGAPVKSASVRSSPPRDPVQARPAAAPAPAVAVASKDACKRSSEEMRPPESPAAVAGVNKVSPSSGTQPTEGGAGAGRSGGVIPKPGLPSFTQMLGKTFGGGGGSRGPAGEKSSTLAHPDSMPCMLGMDRSSGQTLSVDPSPRSRHSIADSSGYEQMSFPATTATPSSSSQPVTPLPSSPCNQKTLNYADLDLGSAESVGDGESGTRTPRSKSRHASAAEERPGASSYAEIDFEKSETLKNANNKDVKFTL